MGLDIVEFVMNVEEAFGIRIPDRDAEKITTPRMLINYLQAKVGERPPAAACLTQHTFYKIHRALTKRLRRTRHSIRPATPLASLIPRPDRPGIWKKLDRDVNLWGWPALQLPSWAVAMLIFLWVAATGSACAAAAAVFGTENLIPLTLVAGFAALSIPLLLAPFLQREFPLAVATVGELTKRIVDNLPPAAVVAEGFPRDLITEKVVAIMKDSFGLKTVDLDRPFVADFE
jgi:hypothetical protein